MDGCVSLRFGVFGTTSYVRRESRCGFHLATKKSHERHESAVTTSKTCVEANGADQAGVTACHLGYLKVGSPRVEIGDTTQGSPKS